MPLPAWLGEIAGAVATTAGEAGARRGGSIAGGAATGPLARVADYAANLAAPTLITGPGELIQCYHAGFLTKSTLVDLLRAHGIDLPLAPNGGADRIALAWDRVIELAAAVPAYGQALKWRRQGRIGRPRFDRLMERHGFARGTWMDLLADDYENVPIGALVQLRLLGWITDAIYLQRAGQVGFREPEAQAILASAYSTIAWQQALDLANRGAITWQRADETMQQAGIAAADDRRALAQLANTLPPLALVVESAARNSWSEEIAQRWGLDQEKLVVMYEWGRSLGLDHSAGPRGDLGTPAGPPSWIDLVWRGHWRLFSVGELLEITRRVRGNPDDPATWTHDVPPLRPEEIDDVLRANAVPPSSRQYYGQVLKYTPISIRHLRIVSKYGKKPPEYINEKLLDIGLSPADARDVAAAYKAQQDEQDRKDLTAWETNTWKTYLRTIDEAYKVGSISREVATEMLLAEKLGAHYVQMHLQTIDVQLTDGIFKAVLRRTRSDLFNGRTTSDGALQRLLALGMDRTLAANHIRYWSLEFGEGRRHLAADKILRLVRKHLLSPGDGLQRLENLGYARPDALLLFSELKVEMDQSDSMAVDAETLQRSKKRLAFERLIKENAARASRLVARLRQAAPPAEIIKWYIDERVSREWAATRLSLQGFDDNAIQQKLMEADQRRADQPGTPAGRQKQERARRRRETSAAKAITFYKDGEWDRLRTYKWLISLGMDAESVNSWLDDADIVIAAKGSKHHAPPSHPPGTNGTTAPPPG